MVKITAFSIETIVTVGMKVRVQNIRTENVFTTHVGLIHGENIAVFDDDAIYVFGSHSRKDDTELFQLADRAVLSFY